MCIGLVWAQMFNHDWALYVLVSSLTASVFNICLNCAVRHKFWLIVLLIPFSGGASSERSSSGLLEWESVNDAMEALAMMNHYQMKNPSECWTIYFLTAGEVTEQIILIALV